MPYGKGGSFNWRTGLFAAFFLLVSIATGVHAWKNMVVGTASEMGPGYFPLMLSVMLGFLSILVFFTESDGPNELGLAPLRSILLVLISPIIFALTIRSLGLVLTVAIVVFVTSFASRSTTLRESFLLSIVLSVFCSVVFHYALALPVPLWGTLFVN